MPSATSDLDRVGAIVLQLMRGPILVLLSVYAIGISGMALVPGPVIDGETTRLNLFHSFYFFTYTVTTTGFGEIPMAFSDEQRLWATVCLYTGVVAWLYAISSIIRLALHPELLRALAERRFAHSVRGIPEPFFVLCGFGDTGSLLARGLSDHAIQAAVLDVDTERIKALRLRNYRVKMPGLCADASIPQHLIDAGVQHPECRALVILTGNDEVNLKIAVMTRFLNPSLRIICRNTEEEHRELLETVGDITLISPFDVFAQQLSTAIRSPALRAWEDWLVGDRQIELENPVTPPLGHWVLCGYGRMGRALHDALRDHSMSFSIIDTADHVKQSEGHAICSKVNRKSLTEAGLSQAQGLVAGTPNDEENLRVLLSARAANPEAFLIVRQNRHENELAFNGADADLIMQPSLVLARHVLLFLMKPALGKLLAHLRSQGAGQVDELIRQSAGLRLTRPPVLWSETLPTVGQQANQPVQLGDLLRNPANRADKLDAIALVVTRKEHELMLPAETLRLEPADEILLCGTASAKRLMHSNINNPYTLHYLVTGQEPTRGWFFQRLEGLTGR